MNEVIKLKNGAFKHVESELYHYHETKREIALLREEILHGSTTTDENIGGGRSNLPGSPTERKVIALLSHKRMNQMLEIVNAIDTVVGQLPTDKRKLVELKYWTKPQMLTWDGIALNLCVSRKTAFRWREEIVTAIGMQIGW